MYKSLRAAVNDLEKSGQLIRIKSEIDGHLEAAEIHRRVYEKSGPAILFEKIKSSPFQAVSNLYGTIDRTKFLFRQSLKRVGKVVELKADPSRFLKKPFHYLGAPFTALKGLPMKSLFAKPILHGETSISQLPQITSWPMDGGAFITLPQVLTLPPGSQKMMESNLGMYRIQLNGNEYDHDREIGMHYQIHRGIGVHHSMYNKSEEEFKASIFVGGPPSHAFSAIMPMPEGLSELTFAGMLAGRRFRYFQKDGFTLSADADFCITGTILKGVKKPEGPFGDHLGYYSLAHDFPVMKVDKVYHRKDPIWHFTVVGRPPQEDSSFGYLIHELVKELTPQEFPGLVELNAVDAAGVHPLLLAIGKERYMPFRDEKPEEILTIANRILGSGQTSLAKFLFIAAKDDHADLNTHDIGSFFRHVLLRVKWDRDLHFQTNTTIDTLDYSGTGWNAGSKVVIACRGQAFRKLGTQIPPLNSSSLYRNPAIALDGVLILETSPFTDYEREVNHMNRICDALVNLDPDQYPLVVISDDAKFTAQTLNNFLWVTFTRANPSHDIYGIKSFTEFKHWGCKGPLVIDARTKPHHAPVLETDATTVNKVDRLFSKGGELYNKI